MIRILLIFLVIYFLSLYLSRAIRKFFTEQVKPFKKTPGSPKREMPQAVETLISCPVCHVFFQRAKGFEKQGTVFCCQDCAAG